MKFSLIITFVTVFVIAGCKSSPITITDSSPLATTDVDPMHNVLKTRIISYLSRIGISDSIIVGQNVGHADGYQLNYDNLNGLQRAFGATPGLMGLDLGFDDFSRDFSSHLVQIEEHWQKGGLLTLSFNPPNPVSAGDAWDKTVVSYTELTTVGSVAHKRWQNILSNVANVLQRLKDKHIIVLWRPLHEMNGGWFWWCNDKAWFTAEEYQQLWRGMHRYFTQERKLDNLLWVYAPNLKYDAAQKDTDYYYPGSEYVDVVGLDYYQDDLLALNSFGSLDRLRALGKPLGIAEIGPNRQRDGSFNALTYLGLTATPAAYFMVWHSWTTQKVALIDCRNTQELLLNTRSITRERMKY